MTAVDEAAAAVRAGHVIVLPTDTVYGLAASPHDADAVQRLYRLKGRDSAQPTAIVAASVDVLLECVPELRGSAAVLREILPGALTLVLPNPAGRFSWVCGDTPAAIGVRVPALAGAAADLLGRVGMVAATSANLPGGPEPRRLADVPRELRDGVAAAIDGGELPGVASTVVDLTRAEPHVVREGAVRAADALACARAALSRAGAPS